MAHLKNIELENFRIFKDKVQIDFHPLTILTGANNSGKSSVIKSLLLLEDNAIKTKFLELDFSGERHHLDSFEYTKNCDSNNNCISINFQLSQFGGEITEFSKEDIYSQNYFSSFNVNYPSSLDVQLKFEKLEERGKLIEFTLLSEGKIILSVKYDLKNRHSLYINLKWLLKKEEELLDENIRFFVNEEKLKELLPDLADNELVNLAQQLDDIFAEYLSLTQFNEVDWYKWQTGHDSFLSKSEEPTLSYKEAFDLRWSKITKKELNKIKNEKYTVKYEEAEYSDIVSCFLRANAFIGVYKRNMEILQNVVSKDIFTESIFNSIKGKTIEDLSKHITEYNYFVHFENFLRYVYKDIAKTIDLLFIQSYRANTQRIYSNQSQGTDFNQLLLDIRKVKFSGETIKFINTWIQKFEIGEQIKFERIKGVATEIKILRKGRYIDLADLGFGATQLLPIILNIALKEEQSEFVTNAELEINRYIQKNRYTLDSDGKIRIRNLGNDYDRIEEDDQKYKNRSFFKNELFDYRTILIEEPETNLHPNFQSKLAELFVDASNKFNIQFIIETHSEYLIRKLQILTAMDVLKQEDSKIYYFYEPDKVPDDETQVKKISILSNGKLSTKFGKGFFDEADNIAIDLFNISKNI
jgi:predicted ATPase